MVFVIFLHGVSEASQFSEQATATASPLGRMITITMVRRRSRRKRTRRRKRRRKRRGEEAGEKAE